VSERANISLRGSRADNTKGNKQQLNSRQPKISWNRSGKRKDRRKQLKKAGKNPKLD
jgi:hypothetical protein